MPEIRYYTVTEVREVKVTANGPVDAMRIADEAFKRGQDANGHVVKPESLAQVWGDTTTRVRQIDLNVKEGR